MELKVALCQFDMVWENYGGQICGRPEKWLPKRMPTW